jgi:hypothetical protein
MTILIILAVVATVATVRALITDGYHRVPTRPELAHR